MTRALIIGAGAAGLLAAGFAAEGGAQVTVLERNARPARKVMITGKGRCNVTNACSLQELIAQVPGNGRFLYSAFSAFSPDDTRRLLEEQGVTTKVERGNRVFPLSDKAVDVVDALVRFAEKRGVRLEQARVTRLLLEQDRCVGVCCEDGRIYKADAVAVCTGGLSYPRTGSTGDGFSLARQAGHTVTPLRPSLVPLRVREHGYCMQMQGLSLKNCMLRAVDTASGKTVFEEQGEMLFTHFGVSGPLILSASAHMRSMEPGRYRLSLDLKPALSEKQLDNRLLREIDSHKAAAVSTMLGTLLPRSMVPVMAQRCALPQALFCRDMTREQRHLLVQKLKAFDLTVEGFCPIEEAIVTAGGVNVKEIDARTMCSKYIRGLYFAGEMLDVDAYTGGFNLQIAFSTGAAAGRAIAQL
ncbi:MAG: NAD(P)/FAD-dependent oxidoreductase [Acutalibacteraceae bacterium]